MRSLTIAVAAVALMTTTTLANARGHHVGQHHHHYRGNGHFGHAHHSRHHDIHNHVIDANGNPTTLVAHPQGCKWTAFCGCGVSIWAFGHPIKDLFLASAWYKFPRDPNGNIAIFGRHHVAGIIKNYHNGTALVYDPNTTGHTTKIHLRNIAHATIVRAGGLPSSVMASTTNF